MTSIPSFGFDDWMRWTRQRQERLARAWQVPVERIEKAERAAHAACPEDEFYGPPTPELERAAAEVGGAEAVDLFLSADCDLRTLGERVGDFEALMTLAGPNFTRQELADLLERAIRFQDAERSALVTDGLPTQRPDLPYWLEIRLGAVLPLPIPAPDDDPDEYTDDEPYPPPWLLGLMATRSLHDVRAQLLEARARWMQHTIEHLTACRNGLLGVMVREIEQALDPEAARFALEFERRSCRLLLDASGRFNLTSDFVPFYLGGLRGPLSVVHHAVAEIDRPAWHGARQALATHRIADAYGSYYELLAHPVERGLVDQTVEAWRRHRKEQWPVRERVERRLYGVLGDMQEVPDQAMEASAEPAPLLLSIEDGRLTLEGERLYYDDGDRRPPPNVGIRGKLGQFIYSLAGGPPIDVTGSVRSRAKKALQRAASANGRTLSDPYRERSDGPWRTIPRLHASSMLHALMRQRE